MAKGCWVAVDKDGTEKISNSLFVRRRGCTSVLWGMVKVRYSKNNSKKWANAWSTNESDPMPFYGAEVPRGTIEKIIGRKMTWDDEPIEVLF